MIYPTFLINLDRQTERLRLMSKQLASVGIDAVRIPAVNGADPSTRAASQVAPYALLTDGEVGCFESHRAFWQKVVDGNLPGAFVLEDDMAVASDLAELTFPQHILQQADIIKVDQSLPRKSFYGTNSIEVGAKRRIVRLLGSEMSTGCYFVTQKGAQWLLERSQGYTLPVDIFLFDHQSPVFWKMEIWKLCGAAAVQLHMLSGMETLAHDFRNRIQGASRPEQQRNIGAFFKHNRLRLRRILQGNTRPQQLNRRNRFLKNFIKHEPMSEQNIEFYSLSDTHFQFLLPTTSERSE